MPVSRTEFSDFVTERWPEVFRSARLLTRGRLEAEDVAQNALARTFEARARVRYPEALAGYVYRVMVNDVRAQHRQNAGRPGGGHADLASLPTPDPMASLSDDLTLKAALESLPTRQREVIVLRFYLDLDVAETARILGCGRGSVKTHTHRAVANLRSTLTSAEPAQVDRSEPCSS